MQMLQIESCMCISVNGTMPILYVATCFMSEFISLRLCFQQSLMFFVHTHLITLEYLFNLSLLYICLYLPSYNLVSFPFSAT